MPLYGPDPRLAYPAPPDSRVRQQPQRPGKGRLYALVAVGLVSAVVVGGALAAAGGGAGQDEAGGGRTDEQSFVNGAAPQERAAGGADEAAGGNASEVGKEAAPAAEGPTAQVRLVGPSQATAGEPIRVVAAFRDLPKGAALRAFVQTMRDGRVGDTKAIGSCVLDQPGEGDTRTGNCPALEAGSYRLGIVVEKGVYRSGDFPPVDVGRLTVVAAGTSAANPGSAPSSAAGSDRAQAPNSVRAVEQRMVELVNAARREAGAGPLSVDGRLTSTSREWSCDMAAEQDLQHDPNFADSGAQGENVAFRTDAGNDVALLLHNQFMNSPGHRDNLLNPRWDELGIGFCARNGFWVTQRFS
jgi:uncharacterized protein YkwD